MYVYLLMSLYITLHLLCVDYYFLYIIINSLLLFYLYTQYILMI